MNPIFIVLPILALLMFDLGLNLQWADFRRMAEQPRAVLIGEVGQVVVLPLIAFLLAWAFRLDAVFFVGVVLIACCPGGSSSNVFSMLARGDVALSVTLTALSSLVTLVTIPLILSFAVDFCGLSGAGGIHLPVGNLMIQNLVLMFLPILLGIGVRHGWPVAAAKMERVLSKMAFPALMLLAGIFFLQHYRTIFDNFSQLGLCLTVLILLAMGVAAAMSAGFHLDAKRRRTIVIEVGMQNAAQAIAVASSPFIFANEVMAVPAIIYALLMNIVLLIYVAAIRNNKKETP